MAPAIRTGERTETRQSEISDRLARAANLLRTRIEVDLEQQNRELLASMNRRARLQLRSQQWVEGLSVAAVSYYVVSLIYYLAQGADFLWPRHRVGPYHGVRGAGNRRRYLVVCPIDPSPRTRGRGPKENDEHS